MTVSLRTCSLIAEHYIKQLFSLFCISLSSFTLSCLKTLHAQRHCVTSKRAGKHQLEIIPQHQNYFLNCQTAECWQYEVWCFGTAHFSPHFKLSSLFVAAGFYLHFLLFIAPWVISWHIIFVTGALLMIFCLTWGGCVSAFSSERENKKLSIIHILRLCPAEFPGYEV